MPPGLSRLTLLLVFYSSPGGYCNSDRGPDKDGHDRVAPQGSARLKICAHQVQTKSCQGSDGTTYNPFHLAPLRIDRMMSRINVRVQLSRFVRTQEPPRCEPTCREQTCMYLKEAPKRPRESRSVSLSEENCDNACDASGHFH
jgi:hypothetical protein